MPKRNLIFVGALAAVAVAAAVAFHLIQTRDREIAELRAKLRESSTALDQLMRDYHLTEAERRRLQEGMLEGMWQRVVQDLREITQDEHMRYIPPGQSERFLAQIAGTEMGLGVRFERTARGARITEVVGGSPAEEAGLLPDDTVLAVDGRDVSDMPPQQLREALGGSPGDNVVLTLVGGPIGPSEPWEAELTGRRFDMQTVQGLYRGPDGRWQYDLDAEQGVYYLRVREFVPQTHEQFRQVIASLDRPRAVVIDLRGNPGGMPEPAAEFANLFLSDGLIFRTYNPAEEREVGRRFSARPENTYDDIRVVVLVDGRTASAAEIVAGSLRAHGRAALVGRRTHGKLTIQSIEPLPRDVGLVVRTTGRFRLGAPDRPDPEADDEDEPIVPDVIFPATDMGEALAMLRCCARALPDRRERLGEDPADLTMPERLRQLDPSLDEAGQLAAAPGRLRAILAHSPAWLPDAEDDG